MMTIGIREPSTDLIEASSLESERLLPCHPPLILAGVALVGVVQVVTAAFMEATPLPITADTSYGKGGYNTHEKNNLNNCYGDVSMCRFSLCRGCAGHD